ncbi:MAG: hypothetical protein J6040_10105 [Clostridiales bacterium]|nr:hypothetical protein [Clostridiales bacterium]
MTSKNELKIQKQRSAALRRLGFFVLILLGCAVLSVLFSYELKSGTGKLSSRFIDVGTLNEEADASSAFSWSRLLIGHSADMLTKLLICVSIFIYGVAIFIISFVATAILSLSGVRKKSHVAMFEFQISRLIYYVVIILSLLIALILTKFTAVLTVFFLTAIWALVLLVYILPLRDKARICEEQDGEIAAGLAEEEDDEEEDEEDY